ncbi:hypothetical protein PENTCL1PPCAC_3370, partial [Pristionchus entomophagus]
VLSSRPAPFAHCPSLEMNTSLAKTSPWADRAELMPTCNCTLVEMSDTALMAFYISYIVLHLAVLAGFFFFGHLIFKENNRATVIIPLPSIDVQTEV